MDIRLIRHIIRFEKKQYAADKVVLTMIVLLAAMIGFSLYLGHERVHLQQERIAGLQEEDRAFYSSRYTQLREMEAGAAFEGPWFDDPSNPLVLSAFRGAGRYVYLEPEPLALIAVGAADILRYYGRVTLIMSSPLRDNALENPFHQYLGRFDFAFVMVWLVPLIIIALSYNMLSREKELGTMRLLHAMPVSLKLIVTGKVIFRFLLIAATTLGAGFLFLLLFGVLPDADVLLLLSVLLLYIAFWFGLSWLVNLAGKSSVFNAMSLTGLWILFLVVMPALFNLIAVSLHPVSSRAVWVNEQRSIEQQVESEREQLVLAFYEEHPLEVNEQDLPGYFEFWNNRLILAKTISERESELKQRLYAQRDAQEQLTRRLSLLSPPMQMNRFLENLSGNSDKRLRSLNERMERFSGEWNAFFMPRFQNLQAIEADEFNNFPMP
ncbi:MAG: ABC transporter permease subunit [Candidatus Cyclonatronum sp.]|uniref:ABC transporter permease subunit n=1 Tax=Cyclonatronum sp. TaxID=3024185 RepID=UPI0025B9D461|nr:ABC transporter permease subunit [Cyclonatronum sp.]MCH8486818.1 ABC transporter permease subunit [Cyclonatronum sp.]